MAKRHAPSSRLRIIWARPWRTVSPIQAPLASGSKWGVRSPVQVGEEEKALRPKPRQRGLIGLSRKYGSSPFFFAISTSALPSSLRNHWKLPPAASTTPMTCQAAEHGVAAAACSLPRGSKPRVSVWAKTPPPKCPSSPIRRPVGQCRYTDCPGRLVATTPDDRSTHERPRPLRAQLAYLRRHLLALMPASGQEAADRCRAWPGARGSSGRLATSSMRVPEGVADFGCERAGQAVANIILGQEHLARPLPVPGARALRGPQELGGRGNRSAPGFSDEPDQGLATARSRLNLTALGRRASDRSREGPGG